MATAKPAAKKTPANSGLGDPSLIPQHKRMAMGMPVDGKTLPGGTSGGKKTPA